MDLKPPPFLCNNRDLTLEGNLATTHFKYVATSLTDELLHFLENKIVTTHCCESARLSALMSHSCINAGLHHPVVVVVSFLPA
jgi:hypothetical protein